MELAACAEKEVAAISATAMAKRCVRVGVRVFMIFRYWCVSDSGHALACDDTHQAQAGEEHGKVGGFRHSSDSAGRTDFGRIVQGHKSTIAADDAQLQDGRVIETGRVVEG